MLFRMKNKMQTYKLNKRNSSSNYNCDKFERIQVKFFWVVTPCSALVGYQHFGGPHCLHLQSKITGDGRKIHRHRPGNKSAAESASH
jgi:hypothetical protein